MTELAEQLQQPGFRFLLISPKEKAPFEKDWPNTANYQYDNPKLTKHLKGGGNFGVLCGFGGLAVIDCDEPEVYEAVKNKLPETFSVKTGGGGTHAYYICEELKGKKVLKDRGEDGKHYGEVQGKGSQVVGPNSIHPNGNKYEVINQNLIATITLPQLEECIKPFIKKKAETNLEIETNQHTNNFQDLKITDVVPLTELERKGKSYQGPHPWHGSTGGQNFSVDPNKNVAFCFRHWAGGGPIYWLAVKEGFINCGDNPPRGETFKKTLAKAKQDYGLQTTPTPPPTRIEKPKDLELANHILHLLLEKKQGDATELLVRELEKTKFYCIRHDEKPELWVYNQGIYQPNGQTVIEERCREILGNDYKETFVNQVAAKVRADNYINPDDFFNQDTPHEIAVKNGILNVTAGTLSEFTPNKIFFNQIPIYYKPDAKCPKIIEHLTTVTKHQEDVKLFQEIFGYLLLKENKYERAFMFVGDGRNGKSKTLELMKRFIGIDNCINKSLHDLENDQWAKGELFGKLANLAGEIGKEIIYKEGAIKELTGRDLISPPRKFKNSISFVNYAKPIFASNDLPLVPGKSYGWWSRWIIIEFPFQFETQDTINNARLREREKMKKRDPDIIEKISTIEELEGLLNWALEGLKRLTQQKGFSNCKTVYNVKRLWKRKSNSLIAFIEDRCQLTEDEHTIKNDFLTSYGKYCKTRRVKIVSEKIIKHTMEEEYGIFSTHKRMEEGREWVWNNIKVVQPVQGHSTYRESDKLLYKGKNTCLVVPAVPVLVETSGIQEKYPNGITDSRTNADKKRQKKKVEVLEDELYGGEGE